MWGVDAFEVGKCTNNAIIPMGTTLITISRANHSLGWQSYIQTQNSLLEWFWHAHLAISGESCRQKHAGVVSKLN